MRPETSCKLNIITLSDVHLGHRKNHADNIVENLMTALPDTHEMASVDVIFIPGDLFDKSILLSNDAAHDSIAFIGYLLKLCSKHNIVLRILEGTPLHDWKQTRILDTINKIIDIDVDAKWVSTLSIEHVESLGVTILYVPDEWRPDPEDTWVEIKQLLIEHKLDKVDFILMHGQFSYQLPSHVKAAYHDLDRYNSITRHVCYCGHVHTHSIRGRVVVPGSFDRLTHNEEGPKGHIRSIVNMKNQTAEHIFVENKNAMRFVTIDCCDMDINAIFDKVASSVKDLPEESHVRLLVDKNSIASESISTLKNKYPFYHWSTKNAKEEKQFQPMVDKRVMIQTTPINERTIVDLVKGSLVEDGVSAETVDSCINALQETMYG